MRHDEKCAASPERQIINSYWIKLYMILRIIKTAVRVISQSSRLILISKRNSNLDK